MKTILIKPAGGRIISVFLIVAFILFLLPIAFVYTHTSGGRVFLLAFMAFATLFFVAGFYFQRTILKQAKKAESLFSMVSISEDGISFPEELEFEYGILNMKGWWSSSGRSGRSYHVSRKFIPAGTAKASNIPFINAEFKMVIWYDGSGFVSAPAVRILSEPYKDVVFLFLTEKGKVDADGTLILSTENDSAQVIVKGIEENITGRVYSTLNKARKVRITISAPESGYKIPIAEGDNFEFSYRMLPEEKILIAGGYEIIDPLKIKRRLDKEYVIMGHGEFILRGILDLPFRRDVSESMNFTVTLEEKEEWGF